MTRKNYTLGVNVDETGKIQYAMLNNNSSCEATFLGYDHMPLFVHERIALLKVMDVYQAVIMGIGRKLFGGMYTIYLNPKEYNELYKLRKSADDTREESQK